MTFTRQSRWSMGAALLALSLVGGCGGGGGGASIPVTPAPSPTPTPTPTPTPIPTAPATSAAVFQTSEYNRSTGPSLHNAISAWQTGASGAGVTIGIIDTGIDTTSPEFAGRISSASVDVAGSRGVIGEDDHGTNVAMIAAAGRDNTGIMGIAFKATIAMFRADTPGSCATADPAKPDSGCSFSDRNIADGIDRAIAVGAKIINLSLGGSPPDQTLINAVSRAVAAGIVVVISAGNDGDSTDPAIDPNNPDPFAAGLRAVGGGSVIIAGSVDKNGAFSAFSNRAGNEATWFLSALGERVCCVYENGVLKIVTNPDGSRSQFLFSGTSFSAPQIAGAAALLRQAFPNLTGAQVVELLLRTARDAGAAGTDTTYGRGILDIANAFAPVGTTSFANSQVAVPLGGTAGITSAPMGDALGSTGPLNAVILDEYQRAYQLDLAAGLRGAQVAPRLGNALLGEMRNVTLGSQQTSLAFSVDGRGRVSRMPWSGQLRLSSADAEIARVLAVRVVSRVSPDLKLGFAYAQGTDGLVAQLQGHSQPAFLVTRSPLDDMGFDQSAASSLVLRRQMGRLGMSFSAQNGSAIAAAPLYAISAIDQRRQREQVQRFGLSLDRKFGAVETALGASWLAEDRTMLGARLSDWLGTRGADTLFLDASASWKIGSGWRLGGAMRSGLTMPRAGGTVASGGRLFSAAWALDASKDGIFTEADSLALRVSQPLRVESGGLRFNLPVAYSYDTLTATEGLRTLSLSPKGRELASELVWRGPLWEGAGMVSLFYRKDPGHFANLPHEQGVAVSWVKQF